VVRKTLAEFGEARRDRRMRCFSGAQTEAQMAERLASGKWAEPTTANQTFLATPTTTVEVCELKAPTGCSACTRHQRVP
jgi:hypothetical protein